ncbi:proton pump-interactor 1-like [Impatiens glandulifera]|uniref:proton pump-interactor 1-like n=1 Tax=Impatiens glandulifera TaxID=253017 RepID=UPI001FB08175|nr:proton pump-interactor 1-like [Impatiens glandulifera]
MGVEVAETVVPQATINGSSDDIGSFLQKAGNGKEIHGWQTVEPIMFGSHGAAEETVVNGDSKDTSLPKDAVNDWHVPKQFHSFFFVKYRFFEDPKLKAKVEEGERKYQKLNQDRFSILDKLRAKRGEKTALNAQIEPLSVENNKYRKMFDDKRKEMEPLQEALGKLRGSGMAGGDRNGGSIYSSEEELNAAIKSLDYRISHGSMPLTEEKLILREMKQLEATRDKVIANSAIRAKLQESLGEKTVIQDQVKHMGGDLDAVKREKKAIGTKISKLIEERNSINGEIKLLEADLEAATKKRDEELEKLQKLRKEKDFGNGSFNANRALLNDARNLAGKQDIEKVKELSETQVKSFISSWSSKKEFREDYERRILASLDARQLSRDGRLRNPGEKPLIEASAPPPQVETAKKAIVRPPKEEVVILAKTEAAQPIVNVQKEEVKNKSKPQKEDKSKQTNLDVVLEPAVETVVVKEKEIPKETKIDEAKLKEIKREEEIAKSKQALERKKKLAEKAATKAAIKAQKDEEKKLKEREKKARKKAAASAPADESDEQPAEAEIAEPEKAEEISEAPVSLKNKDVKDKTVRLRTRRSTKGTDSLPRAILKRKQSTNYWVWALPAGMAVLLLVAAIAYKYLL